MRARTLLRAPLCMRACAARRQLRAPQRVLYFERARSCRAAHMQRAHRTCAYVDAQPADRLVLYSILSAYMYDIHTICIFIHIVLIHTYSIFIHIVHIHTYSTYSYVRRSPNPQKGMYIPSIFTVVANVVAVCRRCRPKGDNIARRPERTATTPPSRTPKSSVCDVRDIVFPKEYI